MTTSRRDMTLTRDPNTALMTIGQLARRTGMSVKALRRLADLNLICPVGRSPEGYRLFNESALWCLQKINTLRGLGLTLAQIRHLGDIHATQPERPYLAELLRAVRARVNTRIVDLEELRRRIDDFEQSHQPELACRADGGLFADDPR